MERPFGNACSSAAPAGPPWSAPGPLLLPQACLIAAVAGILAFRSAGAGSMLLLLLCLLDWPRGASSADRARKTLFLCACCLCALGYTVLRAPAAPEEPGWLVRAAYPAPDAAGEMRPPGPLTVRGEVASSQALPGGRYRVILRKVVPAEGGPAYQGGIVWTLHSAGDSPLPGQRVEARLRMQPVRGLLNPETWDTGRYWHDRNVWFRAWSSRSDTPWEALESDTRGVRLRLAEARARLLRNVVTNLSGGDRDGEARAAAAGLPGAVIPALLFGDRGMLSQEQTDLFARATLAHSLALSGLHLGFAVLAGYVIALGLGRVFPSLWLRIARPKLALLLALPLAGAYMWLGQAPVSLQRAFCMLIFWTALLLCNRPRVLLDGLSAAVAFLLLLDPLALFDIGLQLSALSVTAIALCLPGVQRLARRIGADRDGNRGRNRDGSGRKARVGESAPRHVRLARGAVAIAGLSLCIQVALLPVIVESFGTSGLLFPLNMLWLPVLGAVVLPLGFAGLACTALGFDALASFALYAAELPCRALLALLHGLDEAGLLAAPLLPRPHWLFWAGYWLLLLCLPACFSLWRNRRFPLGQRRLAAHLLLLVAALGMLAAPPLAAVAAGKRPGVSLYLVDVGQGQAVLVEWSGLGRAAEHGRMLVDGGGFSSPYFDVGKAVLAPLLTRQALPRLEYVLNSHPDSDHLGGLLYLLQSFSVGAYYSNGDVPVPTLAARERAALELGGVRKRALRAGDALDLGPGLRLEVLWPDDNAYKGFAGEGAGTEKGNNASLVVRLVWQGEGLALICGDAEAPALRLLEQHAAAQGEKTNPLAARVLVLPHHGAASSYEPALYKAVNPDVALVSSGYANRWAFPRKAVRDALSERGIPLYNTALSGGIRLSWSAPGVPPRIATAR